MNFIYLKSSLFSALSHSQKVFACLQLIMLILAISFITRFFFFLLLNFALFSSIAPKTLFVLVAFCHAVVSYVAVKSVFLAFLHLIH